MKRLGVFPLPTTSTIWIWVEKNHSCRGQGNHTVMVTSLFWNRSFFKTATATTTTTTTTTTTNTFNITTTAASPPPLTLINLTVFFLLLTANGTGYWRFPCLTHKNCPTYSRCHQSWRTCICPYELTGNGETCKRRKKPFPSVSVYIFSSLSTTLRREGIKLDTNWLQTFKNLVKLINWCDIHTFFVKFEIFKTASHKNYEDWAKISWDSEGG